jgi:hypothetical protein
MGCPPWVSAAICSRVQPARIHNSREAMSGASQQNTSHADRQAGRQAAMQAGM